MSIKFLKNNHSNKQKWLDSRNRIPLSTFAKTYTRLDRFVNHFRHLQLKPTKLNTSQVLDGQATPS